MLSPAEAASAPDALPSSNGVIKDPGAVGAKCWGIEEGKGKDRERENKVSKFSF